MICKLPHEAKQYQRADVAIAPKQKRVQDRDRKGRQMVSSPNAPTLAPSLSSGRAAGGSGSRAGVPAGGAAKRIHSGFAGASQAQAGAPAPAIPSYPSLDVDPYRGMPYRHRAGLEVEACRKTVGIASRRARGKYHPLPRPPPTTVQYSTVQ